MSDQMNGQSFLIGLCLALSSCVFIGISFIIKKIGLIRLSSRGLRAASGGFGYLRDWVWWTGLLFMGTGELANFAAYAFAPASLVTPLGALSVLISTLLANRFLNEKLNLLSKLGCILCLLGSTIIVIHAPKEQPIDSLDQIGVMLIEPVFVCYMLFVMFTSFLLISFYAPKYGSTNVLIYILICSLIGSLSVVSVKGLGVAIRQTLTTQNNQLLNPLFWAFLGSVVITVCIQMNYLNKSLDIFDTSVVTPIYYVFFTTFVIIASALLFKEWHSMTTEDTIGSISGFLVVIIAIFLLNAFKEFNISLNTLRSNWMSKNIQNVNTDQTYGSTAVKMLAPDMSSSESALITWTATDDEEYS
ncbi:magnesium transporter NIPA2-like [Oppia nitens]|uniref:magnesium transporter NIPA2-like n=1 Tax=Oppia nitens TaxID=1686743 RepID=UPI0023DCABEF|nr:magnesium transporter NIPA2-like [Oppia nitens]